VNFNATDGRTFEEIAEERRKEPHESLAAARRLREIEAEIRPCQAEELRVLRLCSFGSFQRLTFFVGGEDPLHTSFTDTPFGPWRFRRGGGR
jgi:hypothetical protein